MKKTSVLRPDDMRTNMYFTVLDGIEYRHPQSGLRVENSFLKGDIMKIVRMDLPYLYVTVYNPNKGEGRLIIDVRDFAAFKKLDSKFVKAAMNEGHSQQLNMGPMIPLFPSQQPCPTCMDVGAGDDDDDENEDFEDAP